MNQSNLLDLPTEILLIILKKLDNMDILYSLSGVDNQQLDSILQENTFTNNLKFVIITLTDDILSSADPVLNRFCIDILPKIHYSVKSLILDSISMEKILLAGDYPNLTQLKLFNFNENIVSRYFTGESPFRHIFQEQITDLILDDLPKLKCFSFTPLSYCSSETYDAMILHLFRRMINLEELTLSIFVQERTLIDGTSLYNEIFVYMSRLNMFNFWICTDNMINNSIHHHLSEDDIQQTFTNIIFQQVECIINHFAHISQYHVFSLPFMFSCFDYIGNTFPTVIFNYVRILRVQDNVPFEHEFFIRIACSFPLLQQLTIKNVRPQSSLPDELNSNDNQLYSIVNYSYLISLCFEIVHHDYVEQFLDDTKHIYLV
ncbi:unnamed protein product [Rotaria socialis]|uniref:F-box domain-containing protein n=3 Tax=Rotaria socialis TaxID=392032 RepID=A0A820GXJ3_9BILA|nr:unnamed protein product [Rotaria socialis]CAF4399070.1 unnamed protein product [Rotaria socialis]CAF4780904.1 unnamed protein product [Rotaria socialis]